MMYLKRKQRLVWQARKYVNSAFTAEMPYNDPNHILMQKIP